MATLKDVARLAGVSVKTVSNVVNGYSFVKPDNRARVEAALEATGYRPNLGARNLRRGRTGFIALVLPELSIPYFAELAGLVITAAQEHEWNVLIEQTFGTLAGERSALASLGPHLVDAAILSPEALQVDDFQLSVPAVLLGEHAVDVPISRVGIDNVAAAKTAVGHLVSLGRKRIAAACTTASTNSTPRSRSWFANSTISTPFFAAMPTSMITAIWLKMLIVSP